MTESPARAPAPAHADAGERGSLDIADKVVEKIASRVARDVDGSSRTRRGLPRLRSGLPTADATIAGGRSRIGVQIATAWPTPAGAIAGEVRDAVRSRVTALTGIAVDAVDVTVADVIHLQTERRRVQ